MLDICPTCKGLWFDRGELESAVCSAVQLMAVHELQRVSSPARPCPSCGAVMVEKAVVGGGSLRVDACPSCRGFYLDAGELQRIQHASVRRLGHQRRSEVRLLRQAKSARQRRFQDLQGRESGLEIEAAHSSVDNFFAFLFHLPVEEGSSVQSTPVMVYSLAVALVLGWLWQLSAGVYETVFGWGLIPDQIRIGTNLVTAVTANFLHGGWLHLIGNLYALLLFGDNVEERVGSLSFLIHFVLWGLAGSLLTVALSGPNASSLPHIGASGAIAGVMGAYMVLFPGNRIVVRLFGVSVLGAVAKVPAWLFVGFWGLTQLFSALLELPAIAWWDHLGGLVAGILVGWFYRARSGVRAESL